MGLTFDHVSFSYDDQSILDDVSLHLKEKSFVVVVGPNGAGKSTFLKLAAGLLEPSQGTIQLDGVSCKTAQKQGIVHMVPQLYNKNAAQFPATVFEVIAMMLRLENLSKEEIKSRVEEALHLVGMSEYRDRRIGDLSGGQQQRVMIAQAIARKAHILLLDEPTSGVDFRASDHIMSLLSKLKEEKNLLLIMVTHDITKAIEYADDVVCLNQHVCYAGCKDGFVKSHLQTALAWHVGG